MTLSFNKLNEIAELYESIAASEQEELNEDLSGMIKQGLTRQAFANTNPITKPKPTAPSKPNFGDFIKQKQTDKAISDAWSNRNKEKKPAPTPAAKPAPTPAAKTAPVASPKVTPTKPAASKPAVGTTAGGTKFERRAATSAELKAAQAARAAAKSSGNTKGAEEAAVKAGVAAGKSTLKQSFEYDAYDLVLEYLLSQGHAETVAEAQYLMTEMDAEMIGDIVEGIADRTANAVGHQRAGTLGDADEMRKNQDATSASIGKMKRGSGAKVTPTLPGV
jgi:hypothetical protein